MNSDTATHPRATGEVAQFPPVLAFARGDFYVADKGRFEGFTICDAKGSPVAAMSYRDHMNRHGAAWPDAVVKQRAAFIVRACNSHAALVAVAQKRLNALADMEAELQESGDWGDEEQDELEALQSALSLARKP